MNYSNLLQTRPSTHDSSADSTIPGHILSVWGVLGFITGILGGGLGGRLLYQVALALGNRQYVNHQMAFDFVWYGGFYGAFCGAAIFIACLQYLTRHK
jgi:hypothetical protein